MNKYILKNKNLQAQVNSEHDMISLKDALQYIRQGQDSPIAQGGEAFLIISQKRGPNTRFVSARTVCKPGKKYCVF